MNGNRSTFAAVMFGLFALALPPAAAQVPQDPATVDKLRRDQDEILRKAERLQALMQRLQQRYPNLVLVQGPIHASWLNQIEIYFSIVQRKVLTPNDFRDLADVERRLLAFQRHYEALARPFEWTFTRRDLARLLAKLPDSVAA